MVMGLIRDHEFKDRIFLAEGPTFQCIILIALSPKTICLKRPYFVLPMNGVVFQDGSTPLL